MTFLFPEMGRLWELQAWGLLGTGAVRRSVLDVKFETPIRRLGGGVKKAFGYDKLELQHRETLSVVADVGAYLSLETSWGHRGKESEKIRGLRSQPGAFTHLEDTVTRRNR